MANASEVTDQTSIDAARATVEDKLEGRGLNLLINNAAITKRLKLEEVTRAAMMEIYEVNCVAPLMITKVFRRLSLRPIDEVKLFTCTLRVVMSISA